MTDKSKSTAQELEEVEQQIARLEQNGWTGYSVHKEWLQYAKSLRSDYAREGW